MTPAVDPGQLLVAIDEKVASVRTRVLDLSFNELLDMYASNELVIDPAYQRLFRWTEAKQSRFIESLIIEMPIPPLFAIEIEENKYELIDGLQRFSSYLHFRGSHPDRVDAEGRREHLELSDCDIVSGLNKLTYEMLPSALQIKVKRAYTRLEIIRKESDPRLRYYMFKRLNTGGETLSDQEIRNCTIRLLDNRFNSFLIRLAGVEPFKRCIASLSDDEMEKKYDQELVLRFFAFKNDRDSYKHEVGDFMTEYMEKISDPESGESFDYESEEAVFIKTFAILNRTLGEDVFCGVNARGTFISRFLSYHYESFTLGIQPFLDRLDPGNDEQIEALKRIFVNVKNDAEFQKLTKGGGKNFPRPLRDRIDAVVNAVSAHFGALA